jgi:hypothetical protein
MTEEEDKYFAEMLQNQERMIESAEEWLELQLKDMDENTSGILIFRYGTPEFMVAGKTAKKVMSDEARAKIKEMFPNVLVLTLPFYFTAEMINLEDYLK